MNSLFIGIDVSSKSNVVCLLKPDGAKHSSFSVRNSLDGAKILSSNVASAMSQANLNSMVIGMESTSVYGNHLVYFLREDFSLSSFNKKIHVLNAKQVDKFKESYPDLPKTDDTDAFVIAGYLRFGRINKEVYMDDYRYKALQNLTRSRFYAVHNLTREKQRFLNFLFLKFSNMAIDNVFSNTFGAASLAVIEEFLSVDDIAGMDFDMLLDFIKSKGKNRFDDPVAVTKALQAAACGSYRLPKTINDSVNQVLSVMISSIRALESQISAFDKAISDQVRLIPNTLQSINGIGPVFAAGLIAEIGDINRFDNQASLAKFTGLAWTKHQSGSFEAQNTKLIRSGNRYLRYYFIEAANSVRRCNSEYARFYNLKFKEVNKFQHKRALALTARKLVRLVFALLKSNRLYTPSDK